MHHQDERVQEVAHTRLTICSDYYSHEIVGGETASEMRTGKLFERVHNLNCAVGLYKLVLKTRGK